MKQGILRGFGTPYLSGATPPVDMPNEVVAACTSEADAIRRSILFAKKRFGFRQYDIARLCGWERDNHLSAYKSGSEVMPDHKRALFARTTGCNLLEQYEIKRDTEASVTGRTSQSKQDELVVARMLAAAA